MERFGWLEGELRNFVEESLAKHMPRGQGVLSYRSAPKYLGCSAVDGKAHAIFVCYYPYPSTAKKSVALRSTGRWYTTLFSACVREDFGAERWFDQVFEYGDYAELFELLSGAAPECIVACIQPALIGALVLEIGADTRVVIDIYDSTFFMRRDQDLTEVRLEREVLKRASSLIHKMPARALEEIREAWEISAPDTEVQSLPMRALFQDIDVAPQKPWRLVYAGGIMPYHAAVRDGHCHMVMDPIIVETANRDVDLVFYANQNARNMFWEDQERYFAFQEEYPHFSFREGVPFHQLPREISGFHFGLLYDQKAISSWRHEAYIYNVATKIFSYFEAGLPLLIYDDLEYMCELVKKWDVGVVYSLSDLKRIPELLAEADYPRLRGNVRRYREANELNGIAPLLESAFC